MPGLFVPGIHVLLRLGKKDVDGRDEPGHDETNGGIDKPQASNWNVTPPIRNVSPETS